MAGKLRAVRLQSINDVNRFLANVINLLRRDEIDPTKAAKLGYLANLLMSGFKSQELEDRIIKIERMLKKNDKSEKSDNKA